MINIRNIETRRELSRYVRKISLFESKEKINYKQKLTPSAFSYLSFNSKDIPTSIFGERVVKPKNRLQIAGPKNSEDIFVEYDGKLSQILIEFTASGFYHLFHTSPSAFLNSLSELNNFIEQEHVQSLESELKKSSNVKEQIKILENFLLEKVHSASPFIKYIDDALGIIESQKGNVNIRDLVNKICIGKRQFDRTFQKVVGVTPKTYCKIIQLHYVIKIIQSKQYHSIQDLSYQADFFDQAHFTNRFKELTGFTPSEFIKSDKHIALKYFTDLS
jgi:AraC-like DNA-binding protein